MSYSKLTTYRSRPQLFFCLDNGIMIMQYPPASRINYNAQDTVGVPFTLGRIELRKVHSRFLPINNGI